MFSKIVSNVVSKTVSAFSVSKVISSVLISRGLIHVTKDINMDMAIENDTPLDLSNDGDKEEPESSEITKKVRDLSQKMGIQNKIKVLSYDKNDTYGGARGIDHPLGNPTISLGKNANTFTIAHELSHIKFNHYSNELLWKEKPKYISHTESLIYITICLIPFSNYMVYAAVCALKLDEEIKRYHNRINEEEADKNAMKYCTNTEIRQNISEFQDHVDNILGRRNLDNPRLFVRCNAKGDHRYFRGNHPYTTNRIEYMKDALTDNPDLIVNVTHTNGEYETIYIDENERKMLRKSDTSMFDVSTIDIDLRKESYQVELYDNLLISNRTMPKIRDLPNTKIISKDKFDVKEVLSEISYNDNLRLYCISYTDNDNEKVDKMSKHLKDVSKKDNRIKWVQEIREENTNNIWIEGESYVVHNIMSEVGEL
uniref:Peptidase M48 domain-containing protein n=1 Tax=Pithovirus LCPAC101 TaxID=2506586 RepID=A0A481Z3H1_9VIRU|nr:MAG: hypothetical protein LCPAC101_03600 [Pithovirus LCPAC101]